MNGRCERFLVALEAAASGFEPVSVGAYFAYLKHPFDGLHTADLARRLAADQALLCLPGSMFGPGQEAYLRFAFANVDDTAMAELTARLAAFSRRFQQKLEIKILTSTDASDGPFVSTNTEISSHI